jgi:hypothetical protein
MIRVSLSTQVIHQALPGLPKVPKLKIAVIAEGEVESRLRSYIKKTIADWRPDYSEATI